ncbi:MAG TPA: hypothetical protein VL987_14040 [Cellvibrio sp.]|nr:hypothetical protein [Cellvibrio sp.]
MSILTPTQHLTLTRLAHKGSQWLLAPALWLKRPSLVRWQIQLLEGFSYRKLSHFFYDALAASGHPEVARDLLFAHINRLASRPVNVSAKTLRPYSPPLAQFTRTEKHHALTKVLADLEAQGVRPFLCFGVLLGFLREGDFMQHDADLDIGILLQEHSCNQVYAILKKMGYHIDSHQPDPWPCRLKVTVPGTEIPVDIIFFHPHEGKLQTFAECYGHLLIRNRTAFTLTRAEFQGITAWIPENPEAFLTENYQDWRHKADYHHWVLTSPLTDFSQPIVEYCLARELAYSLYRNRLHTVMRLMAIGKSRYAHSPFWQELIIGQVS